MRECNEKQGGLPTAIRLVFIPPVSVIMSDILFPSVNNFGRPTKVIDTKFFRFKI